MVDFNLQQNKDSSSLLELSVPSSLITCLCYACLFLLHVPLWIGGPVVWSAAVSHTLYHEWIHSELDSRLGVVRSWVCPGGREMGKLAGGEKFLIVTLLTKQKQPGLAVKSLLIWDTA